MSHDAIFPDDVRLNNLHDQAIHAKLVRMGWRPPDAGIPASPHKLNADQTVAVSTDVFWNEDMTTCPRGAKVQLLGAGGVRRLPRRSVLGGLVPAAEASEEGMKRFIDWFLYARQEPDGWAPGQAAVFLLVLSPFFYTAWLLYEGGKP